jgi:cardiolipin synthase
VEIPGTEDFEQLLDREGMPRRESGTLEWLVDGPGFFDELDRQLAAAKQSVDIQLFIYDNDDIAVRYADILKRRAETVPVRLLFDDLGSSFAHTAAPETPGPPGFEPPADIARFLKENSRIQVRRTLNPWLVCDHTKLLVFDRHTAILGGMNMGREYYSEWHDLMVKVEGPVVGSLSREFSRAWRKSGPWGDLALLQKPAFFRRPAPVDGGVPLRLLRTDAARGQTQILDATMLAIRAARQRVWIENPYFAHDDIAQALEAAARRGVDVRVVLPARGDSTIMDAGNLGTARGLIEAGGKVYRYPKMTHMKVMICDGWGCVGSANLDTLSMRINRELNLSFSDPAVIRDLEQQVFLPDFRASARIRLEETASAVAPLAEAIADQL